MNRKLLAIISTNLLLLSACNKELKRDELFAVQGCMAGGFGAAALVYLQKFGNENARDQAVIAGMMGCLAGTLVGYQVGRETQTYVDAETAAAKEIAQNTKSTKELKKYNADLAVNISDYEQQIETIRNSLLPEKEKKQNLLETKNIVVEQKAKAESSLASVEEELVIAQNVYTEYSAQSSTEDALEWEAQIAALNEEKSILSKHVQTLSALDASI